MKIVRSVAVAALAVSTVFSSAVAGAAPVSKKQVAKYVAEEGVTRVATLGMALLGTVWTPVYEAVGAGMWAWEKAHDEKVSAQETAQLMYDFPREVKMLYGVTFFRYAYDTDGEPEDADLQLIRWTYDVKGGWGWDGLRDARSNGAIPSPTGAGTGIVNDGFHH